MRKRTRKPSPNWQRHQQRIRSKHYPRVEYNITRSTVPDCRYRSTYDDFLSIDAIDEYREAPLFRIREVVKAFENGAVPAEMFDWLFDRLRSIADGSQDANAAFALDRPGNSHPSFSGADRRQWIAARVLKANRHGGHPLAAPKQGKTSAFEVVANELGLSVFKVKRAWDEWRDPLEFWQESVLWQPWPPDPRAFRRGRERKPKS